MPNNDKENKRNVAALLIALCFSSQLICWDLSRMLVSQIRDRRSAILT
jgi:hypothetical protein